MNITILDNRDVIINSSDNLGTQNENNASIINFSFPESLMNANKKIVFITDDGNYWDLITNNSYKITNAVSKYKNVSVYVWLVDEQNDIDFRSKIWNVSFNKNEEPDDIVPTEEEISGFDTMITQLNQGLEELDEEKIKLRREYEKVEEGLEDLDEALIQVNNVDIDASKSGNTSTITITNKEGVEKSVQIEDGTDYVITQEDYQAIANVVETDIAPLMPTKTSDLVNDSGFIDNTVNNLTNYYDKTTSDGKYALISESGYSLELSINSSTYVMTLKLKNKNGTVLSTGTVDLPLETMVVNASYDSLTKEIVLTLQNGNTVRFSVADLVSGLQAEITSSNKLASDLVDDTNQTNKFVTTSEKTTWNAKYVKPSGGIPKTDLSSAVQTSLGKADSALQEHQDISGKEDKSNKVTSIDENSTNTQYPGAKLLYDQLAEKQEQIDELVAENTAFKKQISTEHISTSSTQLTDSAEGLPIENVKLKGQTSQNNIAYVNVGQWEQGAIDPTTGQNRVDTTFVRTSDYIRVYPNVLYSITRSVYNSYMSFRFYSQNKEYLGNQSNQFVSTNQPENRMGNNVSSMEMTIINEDISYMRLVDNSNDVNTVYTISTENTPSPAYPQLIHRVTGNCNERIATKNICDAKSTNSYVANGGQIFFSASSNYLGTDKLVAVEPNTTYTISFENYSQGNLNIGEFGPNQAFIQRVTIGTSSRTFTTGSNTYFILPYFYSSSINYTNIGGIVQVELGEEATAIEPYGGIQNAPLTLGNTELYEDDEIEIDYVQKAGYKKVTGARFVKNNAKIASYNGETITTEYKSTTGQLTTGATVVYKLATPVTTEITDQTLLAQLETLINMKTYKEVTNIDLTGEDLAPVLDCDYYQDMSTIKSRIFSYDSATQTLTITI